jgi:hypothetical protein
MLDDLLADPHRRLAALDYGLSDERTDHGADPDDADEELSHCRWRSIPFVFAFAAH